MEKESKKVFLFDANSLVHRAFHALPPLTAPDGRPVQAVYGVASILLKLWKEGRPQYAAALFDRPEPTFRKERYAEYKAQRAKAPDELVAQIIEAHALFKVFGIPVFESAGWEADDLIATLARRFGGQAGACVIIFTGDLDTLQLVDDGKILVRALKTGVSETVLYDEAAVVARYGLSPRQLPDYKALVGDASDNVKGVPGVGPKTASALFQRFGTLEKLYAAAPGDGKLAKKLLPFREEARLAKELVTLRDDAPLPALPLEALTTPEDLTEAKKYFEALGFKALLKRMGAEEKPAQDVPAPRSSAEKDAAIPPHLFLPHAEKGVLQSGKLKVGFALKPFLKKLWGEAGDAAPPYFDCGVAAWLLAPDEKSYAPEAVAERAFRALWGGTSEEYERLFAWEYRALAARGLLGVFEEIEMPLLRVLAEMERRGILVSREALAALLNKTDTRIAELERGIYQRAGEHFNLNSPREVGRILFEKLGIRGRESRTATGQRSTREEALLTIAGAHPIARDILEYREFYKIRSTYLAPLLERIQEDGRVRTEFVQTGTGTGRLSSRNPNLQNIPQNFVWAGELRAAFTAPEGWSLLAGDYTQLELRILAAVSGDEELIGACRRGDDLHRLTAARVLGIAPAQVDDKARRLAKTLNFGLVYGMGARAFAEAAGVSAEEAKHFIAQYFVTFSRVKEWQEETKALARTEGFVQTLSGRRRYLPDVTSPSPRLRADGERAALNHPIQGLGADVMKRAMLGVRGMLLHEGWEAAAHILLSIHDELLLEVRDDMMEAIAPRARAVMEQAYPLKVPLTVKMSAGKDWGHLTPVNS